MLGKDQPIILHLLEVEQGENSLKGLVLELEDSGFSLVKGTN
jgi:malate dehydrogenase